jgi:monoamine oxidase
MESVDVVVVGAGLAGLTAAVDLAERDHRVLVLEARDRVGGRTVGQRLGDGHTIEMGGQWFGPTQTEVLALAERHGLETYPQFNDGARLLVSDGTITRADGVASLMPAKSAAELGRLQDGLEMMAGTLDLEQPWAAANAEAWDRVTFSEWLETATDNAEAQRFWRVFGAGIFAAEAQEISLLHFLFYIASGGGIGMLLSAEDGAQDRRLIGGSHLVSEALARSLGDAVRLSSPVHAIDHDAEGVTVHYRGGEAYARRVVVTLPPTLAGRLKYAPALSARRDQLTQQVPMGSVIKVNLLYGEPFWRAAGLSGRAASFDDPVSFTLDNTPYRSDHGVLVAFVEGAHARRLGALAPEERRATVVECVAKFFGPLAAEPLEYHEKDWAAEEYTRGCYGGRLTPGVWTTYGRELREPVGAIHWAGAETSSIWNGYMDGAVRSGHRAADEVHSALAAQATVV